LNAAGVLLCFSGACRQDTIYQVNGHEPGISRIRLDFESRFTTDTGDALAGVPVRGLLIKVKVMVISDYGKGALLTIRR